MSQISMALGPTVYGVLHDVFDSYVPALPLCGLLNVGIAIVIVWGGKPALVAPHPIDSRATSDN